MVVHTCLVEGLCAGKATVGYETSTIGNYPLLLYPTTNCQNSPPVFGYIQPVQQSFQYLQAMQPVDVAESTAYKGVRRPQPSAAIPVSPATIAYGFFAVLLFY